MLAVTGWALATWAKLTALLTALVAAVWWSAPTYLWPALIVAVLAEWYIVRQLAREWSSEARSYWWWSP